MGYTFGRINRLYKGKEVRADYRQAGNEAIKKYGLKARCVDQFVFIEFVLRPLISEDELEMFLDKELFPKRTDEQCEWFKQQAKRTYRACLGLELEELPKRKFIGIHLGQWVIKEDGTREEDHDYNITRAEFLRGMEMIEAYMEAIIVKTDE